MASDLNEIEIMRALLNNLRSAEDCMRQMAGLRSDITWLVASGRIAQMRELITKVNTQKAAPTNRGFIIQ